MLILLSSFSTIRRLLESDIKISIMGKRGLCLVATIFSGTTACVPYAGKMIREDATLPLTPCWLAWVVPPHVQGKSSLMPIPPN